MPDCMQGTGSAARYSHGSAFCTQVLLLISQGSPAEPTHKAAPACPQEAVLPLEKNTDNWAGLLASTLALEMEEQGANGREINVYMTNQINNRLDAQEIGRVMMESIRRAA